MSEDTRCTLGTESLEVVADRGYYNGDELNACAQAGITIYLPRPNTSSNRAKGQYSKRDFIYKAEDDEYECPAGERLIYRMTRIEDGKTIHRYWSSACPRCPIHAQCTTGDYRRVSRYEFESVLDEVQARVDREPERMRVRRQTVEHPFGTIKAWMGSTHFLTKTLKNVGTEMSLHVLAYNMKRMINIMGSDALIAAVRA